MGLSPREIADQVASRGRNGDTMLMHINPEEVELIESLYPGSITINPVTGQPEAWAWLAALGKGIGAAAKGAAGAVAKGAKAIVPAVKGAPGAVKRFGTGLFGGDGGSLSPTGRPTGGIGSPGLLGYDKWGDLGQQTADWLGGGAWDDLKGVGEGAGSFGRGLFGISSGDTLEEIRPDLVSGWNARGGAIGDPLRKGFGGAMGLPGSIVGTVTKPIEQILGGLKPKSEESAIASALGGLKSEINRSATPPQPDSSWLSAPLNRPEYIDPMAAILASMNTGRGGRCLLYTSPSPRDRQKSRMPSSA